MRLLKLPKTTLIHPDRMRENICRCNFCSPLSLRCQQREKRQKRPELCRQSRTGSSCSNLNEILNNVWYSDPYKTKFPTLSVHILQFLSLKTVLPKRWWLYFSLIIIWTCVSLFFRIIIELANFTFFLPEAVSVALLRQLDSSCVVVGTEWASDSGEILQTVVRSPRVKKRNNILCLIFMV